MEAIELIDVEWAYVIFASLFGALGRESRTATTKREVGEGPS
jgi:hypothetical protein